jgi:hypothetical protein
MAGWKIAKSPAQANLRVDSLVLCSKLFVVICGAGN